MQAVAVLGAAEEHRVLARVQQAVPPRERGADLARLAGSYVAEGDSAEVTLELKAGMLVLTLPGEDRLLLAPVAQTRFRVAGAPGLSVRFEVVDGQRQSATIIESGSPVMKLLPKPSRPKD